MFIFWDLLFGTYVKEKEKVEFGVADVQGGDGIGSSLFYPMKKIARLFIKEKNASKRFHILFGTPAIAEKIYAENFENIKSEKYTIHDVPVDVKHGE
jgi:hypothetical protein